MCFSFDSKSCLVLLRIIVNAECFLFFWQNGQHCPLCLVICCKAAHRYIQHSAPTELKHVAKHKKAALNIYFNPTALTSLKLHWPATCCSPPLLQPSVYFNFKLLCSLTATVSVQCWLQGSDRAERIVPNCFVHIIQEIVSHLHMNHMVHCITSAYEPYGALSHICI